MSDKPTRVLIVEDEAIIAMDLAQRLESYGYVVTGIAASSDQAIELFDSTGPDLVMMDIVIRGGMDGVETAARLRERNIIVRHFRQPRIDQHLRISIGTDAECRALVEALRAIVAG